MTPQNFLSQSWNHLCQWLREELLQEIQQQFDKTLGFSKEWTSWASSGIQKRRHHDLFAPPETAVCLCMCARVYFFCLSQSWNSFSSMSWTASFAQSCANFFGCKAVAFTGGQRTVGSCTHDSLALCHNQKSKSQQSSSSLYSPSLSWLFLFIYFSLTHRSWMLQSQVNRHWQATIPYRHEIFSAAKCHPSKIFNRNNPNFRCVMLGSQTYWNVSWFSNGTKAEMALHWHFPGGRELQEATDIKCLRTYEEIFFFQL